MDLEEDTQPNYNGYANYETWNIVLWAMNTDYVYKRLVEGGTSVIAAKKILLYSFGGSTPDGVKLNDPSINWGQIMEAVREQ